MSISAETPFRKYNGDGSTTTFAIGFTVTALSEIKVYIRDETDPTAITQTLKTLTTHYTITGTAPNPTNIVFVSAPAADEKVLILRDELMTQDTEYDGVGNFPAAAHESTLDKIVRAIQGLKEKFNYVPMTMRSTTPPAGGYVLPDPSADSVIGWNAAGTNLENKGEMIEVDETQTLTNKTIDGDDNTLTDIGLSSLKTVLADADKFLQRDGTGAVVASKDVPAGDVIGTSDTQTMTNKTLTQPTVLTALVIEEQGATPSNPGAGFMKLYFKNDETLYMLDDAGNETAFAAGITDSSVDTLTNKSIDGDDNTITDLGIDSLKTVVGNASKFLSFDAAGAPEALKAVPTGDVIGTTDTQTMTNKTLTSPVMATPIVTSADMVKISTPAVPSSARVRLYAKSDNHLYIQDSTGLESQILDGASTGVPAGTIVPYAGTSTPPTGFLYCDGSAVSRATYAALFSAISGFHGTGDGATTFNLPDLRGRFIRGVDGGSGRDPDVAGRTASAAGGNTGNNVGSLQGQAFQTHTHTQVAHTHTQDAHGHDQSGGNNTGIANGTVGPYYCNVPNFTNTTSIADVVATNQNTTAVNNNATASGAHAQASSNETRPVNISVHWMIKY